MFTSIFMNLFYVLNRIWLGIFIYFIVVWRHDCEEMVDIKFSILVRIEFLLDFVTFSSPLIRKNALTHTNTKKQITHTFK